MKNDMNSTDQIFKDLLWSAKSTLDLKKEAQFKKTIKKKADEICSNYVVENNDIDNSKDTVFSNNSVLEIDNFDDESTQSSVVDQIDLVFGKREKNSSLLDFDSVLKFDKKNKTSESLIDFNLNENRKNSNDGSSKSKRRSQINRNSKKSLLMNKSRKFFFPKKEENETKDKNKNLAVKNRNFKKKNTCIKPDSISSDEKLNDQSSIVCIDTGSVNLNFSSKFTVNHNSGPYPYLTKYSDIANFYTDQKKNRSHQILYLTYLSEDVESIFNANKTKGNNLFRSGNYNAALKFYVNCLRFLPDNHQFKLSILSNICVTYKKLGDFEDCLHVSNYTLGFFCNEEIRVSNKSICCKPVTYWFLKLLLLKAELLELLHEFDICLQIYTFLINSGIINETITNAKLRIEKCLRSEILVSNHTKKKNESSFVDFFRSKLTTKKNNIDTDSVDNEKLKNITEYLNDWVASKDNNIRTLLSTLHEVLPSRIVSSINLKKINLNNIIFDRQLKQTYLKVINLIHPDKILSLCKNDKLAESFLNNVFVILTKSWELYKNSNA